jgi:hypothetical protein
MISASSHQTIAAATPVTIANQKSLQPNALAPDSTVVVVVCGGVAASRLGIGSRGYGEARTATQRRSRAPLATQVRRDKLAERLAATGMVSINKRLFGARPG